MEQLVDVVVTAVTGDGWAWGTRRRDGAEVAFAAREMEEGLRLNLREMEEDLVVVVDAERLHEVVPA